MLLELKNIGKIYNSNDILTIGIREINLKFDYNEFVTIEGESGSGKSTLLSVIAANDSYEEGELLFNGEETSHYSSEDWEKYRQNNIAMIFQDFNIIENLTVFENVELALLRISNKNERKKIANFLIDRVGLTKQAKQKGARLSGGEKQRCVIARALAKDSPIILADEPTGNLDVKASREIAALLKEVSTDKLVIVVTHNPEFFQSYATRRIEIFDGSVKEDKVIERPEPKKIEIKEPVFTKRQNIKNTFKIGFLNYKSRPKFTILMSFALCLISVTLFAILALFNMYLISPLQHKLDEIGIEGKVIISNTSGDIEEDVLDKICYDTNADYFIYERNLSEFEIVIPKRNSMYKSYVVNCLYDPYHYQMAADEGCLVIPKAYSSDASEIANIIKGANKSIAKININVDASATDLRLYLSYDNMENNGNIIKAINSNMKIGENETTAYTFQANKNLEDGMINLVNSSFYDVKNQKIVFDIYPTKIFMVNDDTLSDKDVDGIIIEMSENDYNLVFNTKIKTKQSAIYFANDDIAKKAIKELPNGYIGMLSNSSVYVTSVGTTFALNVLWYCVLIALSVLLAAILFVIFMKSVKIYLADFAIYKTLGISSNVSRKSLYVQMTLIFIPTLVLLPIISIIATKIKSLALPFISIGNYLFIEALLLGIVLFVAYGFNKNMAKSKISQVLRRGSK